MGDHLAPDVTNARLRRDRDGRSNEPNAGFFIAPEEEALTSMMFTAIALRASRDTWRRAREGHEAITRHLAGSATPFLSLQRGTLLPNNNNNNRAGRAVDTPAAALPPASGEASRQESARDTHMVFAAIRMRLPAIQTDSHRDRMLAS